MTLSYNGREATPPTPQTPQPPQKGERARLNRERCPVAAEIIDAFRAVFGPSVQVRYVREGHVELGRIPEKS